MDNKKNTSKGCLQGKTEKQKITFFKSLYSFKEKEIDFYFEQLADLKKAEQKEYFQWLYKHTKKHRKDLKYNAAKAFIFNLEEVVSFSHYLYTQKHDNNRNSKTGNRQSKTKASHPKTSKNKR